jgi:hypothetical protein
MPNFCEECGKKIPSDAKLCPYCGYEIEYNEASYNTDKSREVITEIDKTLEDVKTIDKDTYKTQKMKNSTKAVIIVIVCICMIGAVLISAIGLNIFGIKTDNTNNLVPTNITPTPIRKIYSFQPIADAYTRSEDPYENFGVEDEDYLDVEYWDYIYSDDHFEIIYLKFDLSSIPYDSNIKNAELSLYCWYMGSFSSSAYIGVFGISDNSWYESTIDFMNAPIGTEVSTLLDQTYVFSDDDWIEWDVRDYVQDHLGEKITLQLLTSTDEASVSFYSKDCWYCESYELPRLDIELY